MVSFYTPWKHHKTSGFFDDLGGIERDQWHKMRQICLKLWENYVQELCPGITREKTPKINIFGHFIVLRQQYDSSTEKRKNFFKSCL